MDNKKTEEKDGEISPEQFIAEHTFIYVIKGVMNFYDGSKIVTIKPGEFAIGRKNRLARFNKEKIDNQLEKVFVFFDETFLKNIQEKHNHTFIKFSSNDTIIKLKKNNLLPSFIQSLFPYYNHAIIKEPFSNVKREELLLILLQNQPELSGLLFDYGIPQKINIEEYMNRNFKFNVSVERFAFLTGRSLSAFKRDFKETFNETPNRWLVQRRLQEAHFLINKKGQKPSDIYLGLGFETLSHFSFAFKKEFGFTPTILKNNQG